MATLDTPSNTQVAGEISTGQTRNGVLPAAEPGEDTSKSPVSVSARPATIEIAPPELIEEIQTFERDSCARYAFNNRCDVFLSVLGILLSIAVVGSGFVTKMPWLTAILGAVVGAVVTAQKAFPFGQRAAFYRILIGQALNLNTRVSQKLIDKTNAVNALSSLRMDFAQQLPRGSSTLPSDTAGSTNPKLFPVDQSLQTSDAKPESDG